MPFNIVIRAETGQALPAITAVGTALAKTETQAKSTTTVLTDGFNKGSVSAQKAASAFKSVADAIRADALNNAGRAFAGLSDQLEREANILERLRGPMREYKADLDSLDMLLKKGAIDTAEYTAEMDRLIAKQGTMHGPQQQAASAPEAAGFGDTMGMIMTGGAIGVGLGQIKELISSYQEMQDQFTTLTNNALKFADAGHSVNTVIGEQLNLSHELKGSLEGTMALYDAVRDGTDDLNVSHQEQIRLTKTLGEAVQLANHPLEEADALMSRFSFAMASGRIEGRELKSMMVQIPELADLWTKSFNTTRQGLRQMVEDGRVHVSDLMRVLYQGGQQQESLDTKFQERQRTNAQYLDEVEKRAEVLAKGSLVTPFERAAAMAEMAAPPMKTISEIVQDLTDQFDKLNKATVLTGQGLQSGMSAAMHGATGAAVPGAPGGMLDAIRGPVMHASEDIQTLNQLMKAGTITAEEYRQKYDQLMTTMNDGRLPEVIKLYEEIKQPQLDFHRGTLALDALFKSHRITLAEYNDELNKMMDAYGSAQLRDLLDFGKEARTNKPNSQANQYAEYKAGVDHDTLIGQKMDQIARDDSHPIEPDLEKDLAAFEKITAEEKKAKQLTAEWNVEIAKMGTGVGRQALNGFENGINQINKQIDVSAQATKTLVDAFDGVSNAITDLVTKGTADWSGMIQSMLADMTKLLLYQGLRSIIGGGGGGAGGILGSIPGFATGGSYMTGGAGGTDSQVNLFRTTPGEQVIIRTPDQQRAASDGGPTHVHANVINTFDHRQAALAALGSREGAAIVKNIVAQHGSQLRGYVTKR